MVERSDLRPLEGESYGEGNCQKNRHPEGVPEDPPDLLEETRMCSENLCLAADSSASLLQEKDDNALILCLLAMGKSASSRYQTTARPELMVIFLSLTPLTCPDGKTHLSHYPSVQHI